MQWCFCAELGSALAERWKSMTKSINNNRQHREYQPGNISVVDCETACPARGITVVCGPAFTL